MSSFPVELDIALAEAAKHAPEAGAERAKEQQKVIEETQSKIDVAALELGALSDKNALVMNLKTQVEKETPQVTRIQEQSILPLILAGAAVWWFWLR